MSNEPDYSKHIPPNAREVTDNEAKEFTELIGAVAKTLHWTRAFDYLACFPEFRHAAHAVHKRLKENHIKIAVTDVPVLLAYYFATKMERYVQDYEKAATKPVDEQLYEVMDL